MADIRSYMQEKEKREQKQTGYRQKILKHRLASVYRILLIVAGAVALIALMVVQYRRHIYTDYDIVSSVPREKTSGSIDVRLGNSILTYSKDGVHCTDARGEVSWNQTYQIQDVKLSVNGDTVAIGDYNGRNIYVQNSSQQLFTISTTMPIRDVAVSQTGRVTAVLADTDVAWVNTYVEGKLKYRGEAHMNGAGYPGAISLSPNGDLLCVAYIYVDAGVLKTNIAFYNFGNVGENYNDHIVSSWSYTDLVVPIVRFMNADTAFAVGDGRLMVYSGSQKPVSAAEKLFDEEVQSVFYNEDYIGLVFRSDSSDYLYRLDVYDTSGEKVGSYYFSFEYTDLFFEKDYFVVYNETECMIKTLDEIEKFHGTFSKTVHLMLPASGAYRYVLVTDNSIDTIQLK